LLDAPSDTNGGPSEVIYLGVMGSMIWQLSLIVSFDVHGTLGLVHARLQLPAFPFWVVMCPVINME
tara:strand:- start:4252 stop:4449 length:198 start_codon:yes stop_codon:yes gene_type:complete